MQSREHFRKGGQELFEALKCLPPVDIILSNVKLIRDILPKVKILRDTTLIYGYKGNFNIEGAGQGDEKEPSILLAAFHSPVYKNWWNLTIESIIPKDERTDKSPSDFTVKFSNGKLVSFTVSQTDNEENILIEDGLFSKKTGNNRLQTMGLLEGYLIYTKERLAEKVLRSK